MILQLDVDTRNAQAAAIEATAGTSAIIRFRTGAAPANCAAANTGTVLAQDSLPSDYLTAPSGGSVEKTGVWPVFTAIAQGTIGHYRIYSSDGTTCRQQGDVTITAGNGAMKVDNPDVEIGQQIIVTAYQLTAGNA